MQGKEVDFHREEYTEKLSAAIDAREKVKISLLLQEQMQEQLKQGLDAAIERGKN